MSLINCEKCGYKHSDKITCQELEDRFDGYPKDCIIEDLLEAEYKLSQIRLLAYGYSEENGDSEDNSEDDQHEQ
jgi:hypothetical protein